MRKKIRSILRESVAQRVYHFTDYASEIIESNRLHASTVVGSDADMWKNRGKFYFISLTRSGVDGYRLGHEKLVLNGEKLNQRYKGIPVDYWNFPKNAEGWNNDTEKFIEYMKNKQEKEDRIILNKPYLENLRKYIIEVHRWFGYSPSNMEFYESIKLNNICKKYNIPVYFYESEEDFLHERKDKAVDVEQAKYMDQAKKYSKKKEDETQQRAQEDKESGITDEMRQNRRLRYNIERLVALLSYQNPKNEAWIKENIFGLSPDDPFPDRIQETINKDEDNYFNKMKWNYQEYTNVLSSAIHNIRASNEKEEVEILDLLRRDMKRYQAKGIVGYLAKKFDFEEEYSMRDMEKYYKEKDKREKKEKMGEIVVKYEGHVENWNKPVSVWIDVGEIMKELPKRIIYDPKTIKLFRNQEGFTFKALYKFLMKNVGKKETYRIFHDVMGLTIEHEYEDYA